MQCRICLEDGDQITLLSPCRCRGSSAYIHRDCLERYIQYYPDRICRVCHSYFMPVTTRRDYISGIGVLAVFACILIVSDARLLLKVGLMGVATIVTMVLLSRQLFSTTPIVFLSLLLLLFLPGGNPAAGLIWMCVLAIVAFFYMLTLWVPAVFVAAVVVLSILAGYVVFVTAAAYRFLDPAAFSVYIGLLYLLWYAIVHDRALARYRLT